MFRQFASNTPGGADTLFRLHPVELVALLEQAWHFRANDTTQEVGHPSRRSVIPEIPSYWINAGGIPSAFQNNAKLFQNTPVRWHHLIYAYMVENTRLFDIFRRVVHEYRHDERLGVPTVASQHWLRNTEELFFRDPPTFVVHSVVSHLRPDVHGSRRSAYYRMFSMDLNHGMDDNKPYAYHKAEVANKDFVSKFEEFMREVWIGISNVNNISGTNPTDNATIANLAKELHDMLRTRRISGNLSREEFWYISIMSWFHLTVSFDTPIIIALRAEGASPSERLFKVAERVRLPAHKKAEDFFLLADPMSRILTQIEIGIYINPATVPALYTPGPVEADMRRIITHWSIATGRDMKVRKGVDLRA